MLVDTPLGGARETFVALSFADTCLLLNDDARAHLTTFAERLGVRVMKNSPVALGTPSQISYFFSLSFEQQYLHLLGYKIC